MLPPTTTNKPRHAQMLRCDDPAARAIENFDHGICVPARDVERSVSGRMSRYLDGNDECKS
jgi:hypothetical protein